MKFKSLREQGAEGFESGNQRYRVLPEESGWLAYYLDASSEWTCISTRPNKTNRGAFADCHRHRKENRVN